ncbi:MAG: DUF72 domain-containing protein [Polyangiaceae bacterium]
MKRPTQESLFALPPSVAPVEATREQLEVAARLPQSVRFGTMSWSFEGWRGIVYSRDSDAKQLANEGLSAYAAHPLLRTVEVDRSFYEPLPREAFAALAQQTPEDFRFVVKAHEDCTLMRFPDHARYGKKRTQPNGRFLDPNYALDAVVGPVSEGLGTKLSALLFQFSPQAELEPVRFADALHAFLDGLPGGVPYAVEIRNPALLTAHYADALVQNRAYHCHNIWGSMPDVRQQAKLLPKQVRQLLLVRWLLKRGDSYEGARSRFLPFNRLVEEDPSTRSAITDLLARAVSFDVPALVLLNNKAEGCAPESVFRIAAELAQKLR